MKTTINAKEIEKLGFKKHQAQMIIRQAKQVMVNKGFGLYNGKRIGVVPKCVVEKIIGIELEKEGDSDNEQN